ncbi:MAG: methyltransferase domain-containing protein [Candidatus Promineifilaceae bacterium]|nr:methyltransferase domain-containing protein [Candidatus Promineifilaceae bacterium]
MEHATDYSLPAERLLNRQAGWLAPARSRLLRRVAIAQRDLVLELGAAYGGVTAELARRTQGLVVALDRSYPALKQGSGEATIPAVQANVEQLPFGSAAFDLIFGQHVFMWLSNPSAAMGECARVLRPGGVTILVEPDYGGLIEYPAALSLKRLWLSALRQAGADPLIGRKLPGLGATAGLQVRTFLLEEIQGPEPARFELLEQLPLATTEAAELRRVKVASQEVAQSEQLIHLPYMLLIAKKSTP